MIGKGRTYVSVEDLDDIPTAGPITDLCAGDTLAYIPVPAPKGSGPAVEGVPEHCRLLDGPAGEDGEAAAKRPAGVELCIGKEAAGLEADGAVVILGEELLEGDDVGGRVGGGDAAAYLGDALGAELGDELEAPAVEGEDVDLRGGRVHGGGGVLWRRVRRGVLWGVVVVFRWLAFFGRR
jgi:hypothetical protein